MSTATDVPAPPRAPIVTFARRGRAFTQARRKRRTRRRLVGVAVMISPAVWILVTDFSKRPSAIVGFDRLHLLGYCASVVESLCFWGVLVYVASRRRGVLRRVGADAHPSHRRRAYWTLPIDQKRVSPEESSTPSLSVMRKPSPEASMAKLSILSTT